MGRISNTLITPAAPTLTGRAETASNLPLGWWPDGGAIARRAVMPSDATAPRIRRLFRGGLASAVAHIGAGTLEPMCVEPQIR